MVDVPTCLQLQYKSTFGEVIGRLGPQWQFLVVVKGLPSWNERCVLLFSFCFGLIMLFSAVASLSLVVSRLY